MNEEWAGVQEFVAVEFLPAVVYAASAKPMAVMLACAPWRVLSGTIPLARLASFKKYPNVFRWSLPNVFLFIAASIKGAIVAVPLGGKSFRS